MHTPRVYPFERPTRLPALLPGLRRAQGPDGGVSASRACFIGGFHATSNVLAGKLYGIPVRGTMAHSFVQSFAAAPPPEALPSLCRADDPSVLVPGSELLAAALRWRDAISEPAVTAAMGWSVTGARPNAVELVAFVCYAASFPTGFVALLDTHDTLNSGLPNYLAVALTLLDLGYPPQGVRLDSGDLAALAALVRRGIDGAAAALARPALCAARITVSSDVEVAMLLKWARDASAAGASPPPIDSLGVGTHLVTCKAQPALGAVYKLVSASDLPCRKHSEETGKATLPGKKALFRLYLPGGAQANYLALASEAAPAAGVPLSCVRVIDWGALQFPSSADVIVPEGVEEQLELVWEGGAVVGPAMRGLDRADDAQQRCAILLRRLPAVHTRLEGTAAAFPAFISTGLLELLHI